MTHVVREALAHKWWTIYIYSCVTNDKKGHVRINKKHIWRTSKLGRTPTHEESMNRLKRWNLCIGGVAPNAWANTDYRGSLMSVCKMWEWVSGSQLVDSSWYHGVTPTNRWVILQQTLTNRYTTNGCLTWISDGLWWSHSCRKANCQWATQLKHKCVQLLSWHEVSLLIGSWSWGNRHHYFLLFKTII